MSKVLSRNDITDLIGKGRAIVIYKDYVLDLTNWIHKHPGGDTAVHHMIGRDATDEMNAYHSMESIELFTKWKVGRITGIWENLLPPIQGGVYKAKAQNEADASADSESQGTAGLGFPAGTLTPAIIQIPTKENKDKIFPVSGALASRKAQKSQSSSSDSNGTSSGSTKLSSHAIVDPRLLIQDYDNQLSQEDVLRLPSLDYETQKILKDEYAALHNQVVESGFYTCNYWDYGREIVKITLIFLYAAVFFKLNMLFVSATLVGLAWHQMTFIAHDAGHVSISHNYQYDNLFGMLIANWFGGLSLGWWKRNHNVHHLVTNDPAHDPDIQHLPFFAVSVRLLQTIYSTYYKCYLPFDKVAEWMIPIQNYMYYPILCFGRFNLYALSWMHLIRGLGPRKGQAAWFRYFELAGLTFFFYWFFYLIVYKRLDNWSDRFLFILVSHVALMPVHVQITLSHFAMSTSDLGLSESFPLRQLRTTMDVDCPEWLDFLHGGLQFQAIHHLFPRLPRHNLRRAQPLVIDFCEKVGLKYSIYGFGKGNDKVIGKLAEIGKQCSIMVEATKELGNH